MKLKIIDSKSSQSYNRLEEKIQTNSMRTLKSLVLLLSMLNSWKLMESGNMITIIHTSISPIIHMEEDMANHITMVQDWQELNLITILRLFQNHSRAESLQPSSSTRYQIADQLMKITSMASKISNIEEIMIWTKKLKNSRTLQVLSQQWQLFKVKRMIKFCTRKLFMISQVKTTGEMERKLLWLEVQLTM